MISVATCKEWFDEVKKMVAVADPYHYEENSKQMVEYTVYEPAFEEVSKRLGWA